MKIKRKDYFKNLFSDYLLKHSILDATQIELVYNCSEADRFEYGDIYRRDVFEKIYSILIGTKYNPRYSKAEHTVHMLLNYTQGYIDTSRSLYALNDELALKIKSIVLEEHGNNIITNTAIIRVDYDLVPYEIKEVLC